MKEFVIKAMLILAILTLSSCSGSLIFQETTGEVAKDISLGQKADVNPNNLEKESLVEGIPDAQNATINLKELNLESENTYTIKHEKGDLTYIVSVVCDFNYSYTLHLFDANFNELQSILLGQVPAGIEFMDINSDGYVDLMANTGGALNETHELYIWDIPSQNFVKVVFQGFDMLSYFEIHEGYIMNWVKDTASSGAVQKLIWRSNTLIIESEEFYELEG